MRLDEVVAQYPPPLAALTWLRLEPATGFSESFSGAEVYRGVDSTGQAICALKLWPADSSIARLGSIHQAMTTARTGGCLLVPALIATVPGDTIARTRSGRVADVTAWVPGASDADPSPARLRELGSGLANLHAVWRRAGCRWGCPPVLARRQAVLGDAPELAAWRGSQGPIHIVLGDLRLEHARFTEQGLAGLVDYGAVGVDSPAVDVARLATDLPPTRLAEWCAAYNAAAPERIEPEFVRALAITGLAAAVTRWATRPGAQARFRHQERAERLAAWRAAG